MLNPKCMAPVWEKLDKSILDGTNWLGTGFSKKYLCITLFNALVVANLQPRNTARLVMKIGPKLAIRRSCHNISRLSNIFTSSGCAILRTDLEHKTQSRMMTIEGRYELHQRRRCNLLKRRVALISAAVLHRMLPRSICLLRRKIVSNGSCGCAHCNQT